MGNDAWVSLCGFSKYEARHHSLDIIQGPETNERSLKDMIEPLLVGDEVDTVVTNYTKSGRKFHNYIRAGPLVDTKNHITHFVGVLQELSEQPEHSGTAQ